ncbi:nuclear receptor corepressor 2 isoform X2 [Parasteatoda tepidariorum]|uniref:nuclear receptor corepressor 2 isoform X2 n=1 Tax=Parasteatoda tepidariorum TaxID=114398 RepID=UPI00077FB034|nr:uncharacterized protein LOC107448683 isoform X2 [Parasteatoda tepidariorum]
MLLKVDSRQSNDSHAIERYNDQHVRRRLNLRPTPALDYNLERERYLDAMRYQYEREVALGVPYSNSAMTARTLKPPVVSVHTPSEIDAAQPIKRPRLAVEPKAPVHQPLLIDTRNVVIKKEPAYTPQVEAISPTLPSEEGRCESPPSRVTNKDIILGKIKVLDKEINQVENQINKLQKKATELEAEANKPSESKEAVKDVSPVETKQMSVAQIIYSENRSKAQESHAILEKLGPKIEIPMYNQPSDTAVYYSNKQRYQMLKSRLSKCLKRRHRERELREKHLTESYSKLMQDWTKKMEKKESNAAKKAKDSKLREFFEKQFPELKKQREDKERISRVSTRIRSESEWEEIIDGLQEQEMEEKKMRSYAVIPPIILDSRQRRLWYVNNNGLVEDLSQEYKEKQLLNIWTDQEKEIFREKYLQHPKNFAFIASCLDRKTVADCVQYYYLSKKSENYKQLLKRHSVRKRTRALVKPPQNQQVSQSTGVTTRQQEDAKASLVSSCSTTQSTIDPSYTRISECKTATVSSPAIISCSVSITNCTVVTTVGGETCTTTSTFESKTNNSSTSKYDLGKMPLPNNIRKKKEIQKLENKEDHCDSDTSDHPNENNPSQPCAVCKQELDNFLQSRPLTRSNCSLFGLKESDLVGDMRVCASCRFKSVRKRCPIPTCKTPKRKVKRLRPLPVKLAELSKEAKDVIIAEIQIPPDVNKCCSACFNRIVRKLENNPSAENESNENSRWSDEEMDLIKEGLKQHGMDWEAVSNLVNTKTKQQCRNFYFNYRRKYGLEDIVQEYKKLNGGKDGTLQDGKRPPIVTDEEESGETTSSCDENDHFVDSDTASAPSPVEKVIIEDKSNNRSNERLMECNQTSLLSSEEPRNRGVSHIDSSPKCPPDYDSSATVSADEGQNQGDGDGRDSSPRGSHPSSKTQMGNESLRKPFQCPLPIPKEVDNRCEASVPIVKTLLQDPKIGATPPENIDQLLKACKPNKDEPTSVKDLIYQAIEMSLNQWPNKSGRNSSPIPSTVGVSKEVSEITILDPKKDGENSGSLIPPTAHCGSRHPSRPSSHHMEVPPECEVQDLSKKVKSRDVSPVKDFTKRERIVTPVRPPSGSGGSSHINYMGAPPPAHCNQFRTSQPPPPALSPHYVAEPHHEAYFSRTGDSRSKQYASSERPLSQPPHLVAQTSSLSTVSPIPTHAKPVPIKATVPPPPPLVASKPSQLSPKTPYKERLVALPPTGSITQGTPVNQQSMPVPPTNLSSSRYEGYLRQLPPTQTKDGGSITLGTPVPHDSVKRVPTSRSESFGPNMPDNNLVRQAVPAMYDPTVMEYYRQVGPTGQQYSFPPGYSPYPPNVPAQRPSFANESQLSSKQIIIDYNTSKQMQLRRGAGGPPEKEMKVSPRGTESNPPSVPPDSHLHPMYPPANYQTNAGSHYNHVPSYPHGDSRYLHHRSPSAQTDRTRSPSGVESPHSTGYSQLPGKRSPSLALSSGRQNVIHRSITYGTAKPSVIQAPQSASPRTFEMRSETVSPASARKSTPSPRHPQPLVYSAVPSGHDAFNTLVNAAVAQPSLAVPKDGKGSPTTSAHNRQDVKSPRDRPPVVEGLEKTLIDMHQRPRSYTESGHNLVAHERGRTSEQSSVEQQSQSMSNSHRYSGSIHNSYDMRDPRNLDKAMLVTEQFRLGNMREPFSREQFERQMRQPNMPASRDRISSKKDDERNRSAVIENQNYSNSQQSDLDNEASKIFSQSFQKDPPSSSHGVLTASSLIDAIITRQINSNEPPIVTKYSSIDLFNQYNSYDDKPNVKSGNNKRAEVVTIDDEPENEKLSSQYIDKHNSRGRSPPVSTSNAMGPIYSGEKAFTLNDHIAAIISKDYNNPSDLTQSHRGGSQSSCNSSRASPYTGGGSSNSHGSAGGKPLEGIASSLPSEGILLNSNVPHGSPDHSPQNCPGNGCSFHTHSWKLRRALQQDRERDHRSPGLNENAIKRPSSNQSSDSSAPQEERQIIRVAQTSSPSVQSTRISPTGPYGVEPISPPSQTPESTDPPSRTPSNSSVGSLIHNQPPAWANNPSITGLLTTRLLYPQEYPEGIPPSSIPHYATPSSSTGAMGPGRPPHQQQMGLSPLDYVKNRIVEVMRTATDVEPESSESRRPHSAMSHAEEREQLHIYRFQPGADREGRELSNERPCSTGNGPPLLQGQRYSPAVSRYSPVPPRPSSAVERVPSRNSTPSELSRQHKRGSEGHLVSGDWREGQVSSRANSRSVSPSVDHPDSVRKKTRSEGTFIPESTTDRAPVLLPQNSTNIHRSGSLSEAPRLSSSNQGAQVLECQSASKSIVSPRTESYHQSQTESDCYKYRVSESRPENQWSMMNNHNRTADSESLARLNESMSIGAASSTTEPYSPSSRGDAQPKSLDRSDSGTRQSPVTSSGSASQEPSRSSPSASSQGQRSATSTPLGVSASPSSGLYSPFGTTNGGVSSSTNVIYSSASSLPPPASPHVAYSSFSGMGTTYAYPYSALSMRTLAASTTHSSTSITNSTSSVSNSHVPPLTANSASRNSPSSSIRNNQPPPLLSSQYEPLSDED